MDRRVPVGKGGELKMGTGSESPNGAIPKPRVYSIRPWVFEHGHRFGAPQGGCSGNRERVHEAMGLRR